MQWGGGGIKGGYNTARHEQGHLGIVILVQLRLLRPGPRQLLQGTHSDGGSMPIGPGEDTW